MTLLLIALGLLAYFGGIVATLAAIGAMTEYAETSQSSAEGMLIFATFWPITLPIMATIFGAYTLGDWIGQKLK